MLESKDYYIDLINSSKAYQMTAYYHYSKVGFKKAQINQGIYRKSDNLLVGVLQWGISAQEGIRLDRYVKEPLDKTQYLELNRFCMADSEPRNAESQAIALGIKWIKVNRPDIKLLVSYAGRKEGNYGYIYQATNWEYLGYFISNGFWVVDGNERHQITLWYAYKRHADTTKGFKEGLCDLYHDVRQTWSKQFIYIKRLDKKLHCASPVLPYPKPTNEYPICTQIKIYKEDAEFLATKVEKERTMPIFYYEKEGQLFGKRTIQRRDGIGRQGIAVYNKMGFLETTVSTAGEASKYCNASMPTISRAVKEGVVIKNTYFLRKYDEKDGAPENIEIDAIAEIDGLPFVSQKDIAEYCEVSKQAVSYAKLHNGKHLGGREVIWK